MMMSLFSMFDPTAILSLPINWMIMYFNMLILPMIFWKSSSRSTKMLYNILNILNKEFNSLFSSIYMIKGTTLMTITLFFMIMINNLTSNFPYTFCCTAHLVFSFSLAMPIWLSIILFCWINLSMTMLAHLVPSGTPILLMPLMVMIEMISNIIRPLALGVRLTANLIAGHLLMALLGNTFNINSNFWMLIVSTQIMFMSFELMVALIQSYVFSVLMTLYSSEIS